MRGGGACRGSVGKGKCALKFVIFRTDGGGSR